jgi:hypothetical protein
MRYVAFFKVPPERLEDFVKGWTLRAQAEKVKVVLPPHTLYESYQGVTGFVVFARALRHPEVLDRSVAGGGAGDPRSGRH